MQTLYDNPYTLAVDATARTHLCVQANGSLTPCTFTNIPDVVFETDTCSNVVKEVSKALLYRKGLVCMLHVMLMNGNRCKLHDTCVQWIMLKVIIM